MQPPLLLFFLRLSQKSHIKLTLSRLLNKTPWQGLRNHWAQLCTCAQTPPVLWSESLEFPKFWRWMDINADSDITKKCLHSHQCRGPGVLCDLKSIIRCFSWLTEDKLFLQISITYSSIFSFLSVFLPPHGSSACTHPASCSPTPSSSESFCSLKHTEGLTSNIQFQYHLVISQIHFSGSCYHSTTSSCSSNIIQEWIILP